MVKILQGDCLTVLKTLPDESVQMCVTSPPYWGLRDYGIDGQLGLEKTLEEYVAKLVEIFREVRRVLRGDGTLWLNLGDSYSRQPNQRVQKSEFRDDVMGWKQATNTGSCMVGSRHVSGLKPKDLIGIPWMVAFALRADGWYLRSDIIWAKPNPMPESATDRPTKSHEYIFLLTKSGKYYYDMEAIKEKSLDPARETRAEGRNAYRGQAQIRPRGKTLRHRKPAGWDTGKGAHGSIHRDGRAKVVEYTDGICEWRNKRSVWTVATAPYSDAHFATFPPKLITPCILAGCPVGGTVLDHFGGSGTTGMVSESLGRNSIIIELKPEYCEMAKKRTQQQGLAL